MISDWDDETVLRMEMLDSPPNTVLISGNRAGLTSLARHLLTLTQAKAQRSTIPSAELSTELSEAAADEASDEADSPLTPRRLML